MPRRVVQNAFLALLLLLTGCLPSSCRRQESRALFPADSLSRALAEAVPMDTLRLAWRAEGSAQHPLVFPRTVLFGREGRVYVGDVERGSILVLSPEGNAEASWTAPEFEVPYLAGWQGDTLVVFSPESRRLDFVVDGRVVGGASPEVDAADRAPLVYAAADENGLYVKTLGEEIGGTIAQLDGEGQVVERYALPGPYWRHAGFLRPWGDSLLSLSGYRPVVDVVVPGSGRDGVDTLALAGFDSPMLARSRLFMRGQADEPPLLTPTAAAAGDLLFVVNLRAGWLRVDVFDRSGRLVHRLSQADPTYGRQFFPQDLAVRRRPDGAYELAVAFKEPTPRVELYRVRWPE